MMSHRHTPEGDNARENPNSGVSTHDDASTTTETFERTFSFWNAGIAPDRLVDADRTDIRVADAKIVGDAGDEEVVIEFEVDR